LGYLLIGARLQKARVAALIAEYAPSSEHARTGNGARIEDPMPEIIAKFVPIVAAQFGGMAKAAFAAHLAAHGHTIHVDDYAWSPQANGALKEYQPLRDSGGSFRLFRDQNRAGVSQEELAVLVPHLFTADNRPLVAHGLWLDQQPVDKRTAQSGPVGKRKRAIAR
jgi:hypothetical protein